MHPLLEPRLLDATGGEPGLVVEVREERRALLVDLADLRRLLPRVLLRVSHAFVTHTHMDHFAGFDHLLFVGLGRMNELTLWGGPRFVEQVEHKLRAYTWNVVHRYEVPLTLHAREIDADGRRRGARFSSETAFEREDEAIVAPAAGEADVLHDEALFRVRARFVDHETAVLAYALEEKPRPRVMPERLAASGLRTGPWLRELKDAVLREETPLPDFMDLVPGRRIGYVTDLRFTEANVAELEALLSGVDLLFIESVFLDADAGHAARKNHLTARQAGEIARRVGAKEMVPFHHSPRYEGRLHELVEEARAAWQAA